MSPSVCQGFIDLAQNQYPQNGKSETFDDDKTKTHQNADMGGWSFLQSLCNNTSSNPNRPETQCTDKIYVHPLLKRSSSKLSGKSLEMCTESLGSETGSESGDEISLLSLETSMVISAAKELPNSQEASFTKKKRMITRSNSFPPPIKSIRSSNNGDCGVKVRSYREDGRLVLQAVRVSSPLTCFQAERSEGRLRLCFVEDSFLKYDYDEAEEKEFNAESYEEEEEEEENKNDKEGEEEKKDEEEDGDEEDIEEGIVGNNENFEGKIGTEKISRLSSRCKESGHEQKGLLNWEQFWVAT